MRPAEPLLFLRRSVGFPRQFQIFRAKYGALFADWVSAVDMLHDRGSGTGRIFPIMKPRWFADAVREAGMKDFTWHCLRHTFASRLVMAGVDIRTVQELMGHKSITMTMRYAHLSPEHNAAALEKLCVPSATTTATDAQRAESAAAQVVN